MKKEFHTYEQFLQGLLENARVGYQTPEKYFGWDLERAQEEEINLENELKTWFSFSSNYAYMDDLCDFHFVEGHTELSGSPIMI